VTPDVLALGAALAQPWASVVLSGAATTAQLASNLRAAGTAAITLPDLAEPAARYWATRSSRPWT
jgi:aryl-alcohol dehydrogenase-like predicted oxidoreductase